MSVTPFPSKTYLFHVSHCVREVRVHNTSTFHSTHITCPQNDPLNPIKFAHSRNIDARAPDSDVGLSAVPPEQQQQQLREHSLCMCMCRRDATSIVRRRVHWAKQIESDTRVCARAQTYAFLVHKVFIAPIMVIKNSM